MKKCKSCGSKVDETATYCQICGATAFETVDETNSAATNVNTYNNYNTGNYQGTTAPVNSPQNMLNSNVESRDAGGFVNPNMAYGTPNNTDKKKNPVLGIVGAVIGFAAAILIWFVATYMGYFIYIQGVLLVVMPYFFYKAFSKSNSIIAAVIISAIALLIVYPVDTFSNVMKVKKEYNEQMGSYYSQQVESYEEARELYDYLRDIDSSYDSEVVRFLVFGYISTAVGVIAAISGAIKEGR
ncbi:MAG: DUF2232 domain-containing protein [Lachnospiraceae bacterium]|nr:DUF2232 domain-containing protein [Lachnospiraceae bacterium]